MATDSSVTTSSSNRSALLVAAGIVTAGGVLFMIPVVGFPGIHSLFDDDHAARDAGVQAHYANMWTGAIMFGVAWLLMGYGLFALCRQLARLETGWKATALHATGVVLLAPFTVLGVVYASPWDWGTSASDYVAALDDPQAAWETVGQITVAAVILAGWLTIATVLVKSSNWPTWLGITFGVLGILTVVTLLPLFAALGAILLGVWVWRGVKPGPEAEAAVT